MLPSISIITPSYNQGRFIERTLISVVAQEISGLEYLVVDGGSTDQTLEVLQRYSQQVRWFSERDQGHADGVNKGIRRTHGDIIGWLNSDDIYYPEAIARVLEVFAAHPEVDVVYGRAKHIDTEDRPLDAYPTQPFSLDALKQSCFLCQPATFFRRRVVERFGLLDPAYNFVLDYEYWLRLALGGAQFYYLDDDPPLAGSRLYPETVTMSRRLQLAALTNDMVLHRAGRVEPRGLYHYALCLAEHYRLQSPPLVHGAALMFLTLGADLRWNHHVSRPVLVQALKFFHGGLLRTFRLNRL